MNHVTLVSGVRLRPGTEDEHRELHDAGVAAAQAQGGLVRAELVPAVIGVQDDTVAPLSFATRGHLDAWLASPARADVLQRMEKLAASPRNINVLSGFPGWFGPKVPPRWKQAIAVIAGLVPVAYGVSVLREAVLPSLGHLPAVALTSAINVCVLTWVVMPTLTRLLGPWLSSSRNRRR